MAKAWMPMYWGDYLTDTQTLTPLEHGCYLLLIGHLWQTERPFTREDAYNITRCRHWREKQACDRVIDNYFEGTETLPSLGKATDTLHYTNKRTLKELTQSAEKSDRARKNAAKRWGESDANASKQHSDSNANHNHNHNHTFTNVKDDPPTPFDVISEVSGPPCTDATPVREHCAPTAVTSPASAANKPTPPGHARFFTLKRPSGLEVREDEWLYERLIERCDRRKLLDQTPCLDALCRQHGRSQRLRAEWLRHPLPCRMAAAAIVETSPHVEDGLTYGLKAIEQRWEQYQSALNVMKKGFDEGDLTVTIEE